MMYDLMDTLETDGLVRVFKRFSGDFVAEFTYSGVTYSAGGDSASRAVWQLLSLFPWIDSKM